jgi:hypothetical protein
MFESLSGFLIKLGVDRVELRFAKRKRAQLSSQMKEKLFTIILKEKKNYNV